MAAITPATVLRRAKAHNMAPSQRRFAVADGVYGVSAGEQRKQEEHGNCEWCEGISSKRSVALISVPVAWLRGAWQMKDALLSEQGAQVVAASSWDAQHPPEAAIDGLVEDGVLFCCSWLTNEIRIQVCQELNDK